jgi:hypothetical protein
VIVRGGYIVGKGWEMCNGSLCECIYILVMREQMRKVICAHIIERVIRGDDWRVTSLKNS